MIECVPCQACGSKEVPNPFEDSLALCAKCHNAGVLWAALSARNLMEQSASFLESVFKIGNELVEGYELTQEEKQGVYAFMESISSHNAIAIPKASDPNA